MRHLKTFRIFESQDGYKDHYKKWSEDKEKSGTKFNDWTDKLRAYMNDKDVPKEYRGMATKEFEIEQEQGGMYNR